MYINIHLSGMDPPGRSVANLTVPGLQLAWGVWERVREAALLVGCQLCLQLSRAGGLWREVCAGKGDLAAPQRSGAQMQLKLFFFYIVICFKNAQIWRKFSNLIFPPGFTNLRYLLGTYWAKGTVQIRSWTSGSLHSFSVLYWALTISRQSTRYYGLKDGTKDPCCQKAHG